MPKQYKIKGKLFPRAHLTLIGFNKNGYRKYGGAGFCFTNPCFEFKAAESKDFKIEYKYSNRVTTNFERISILLNQISKQKIAHKKLHFKFEGSYPQNSGFGTGTNLTLACIETLLQFNQIPYTKEELISLSGRGKTSGVGIQTYFHGSYIMDIGVKNNDNIFLPSNNNYNKETSRAFLKAEMPDWPFIVCIPKKLSPLSITQEREFFQTKTPFKEDEVSKILYEVVFGLSASILDRDFESFCKALNTIQKTKWKNLERGNYFGEIEKIEKDIMLYGAKAIAMSSLGPSLIIFSDDVKSLYLRLSQDNRFILHKATPYNSGRIIYA
jgi:beta-ribofuranosylaminobenzene 5'-phosphate synthase